MNNEELTAELHCSNCDHETIHTLVYAGRLLVSTTCQVCNSQVKHEAIDLRLHYLKDLEHRIATKPRRLLRRFWRSPFSSAISLPKKFMSQPRKIWSEIKSILGRN